LAIDVSKKSGDKKRSYIENERKLAKESGIEYAQEVIIINYDSIWREPFKKYLLNKYKADCVICDESHRIKSPGSKCSKMLNLLGRRTPNRFLVTGTPLSQSPLDIYAQYRFLCSDIFGTQYDTFKNTYSNQITIPHGGFTILDKKNPWKNLDELHEKMFSCAFYAEVDLDLPPTRDINMEFEMSAEAQKYYKELQKEGCLELRKGVLETGNVLTIVTRLQQLCSGYLPVEDEDGKKVWEEIDDCRQEAFRELIDSFPEDEPIVVFAKYRKDIKNIRRIVHEIGRKSSELSGVRDTMQNWVDGKTQVLVIQISSGAEGLNELVKSRYCIYYTLHHSNTLYQQSRKRLDRPGQTRSVTYYHLVAKMKKGKTIDEKILESIESKQDVIDMIMDEREI
jgi:SNF2 family DNA or RNA helicase